MTKARGTTAPKEESKADKFVRLAEQRVTSAVKYINSLGNLGGPAYEHSPEQTMQIVTALANAVKAAGERLEGTTKQGVGFKLS
jgi:hypothetical protein